MPDNTPFEGSWGRPQNDGPAIRASALMAYANHYMETEKDTSILDLLYKNHFPPDSVIKADLEYVSNNWEEENFDLWEEVKGVHFFTLMVQLRALREGTRFAASLNDTGAAEWYGRQAGYIEDKLEDFWNADGWMISTLNRQHERSGLDCGVLLGSIHGTSALQTAYAPNSDRMLSTHYSYGQAMKKAYKINQHSSPGVAVGRYTEDLYDGYAKSLGNPWYLCDAAAAQQMYMAVQLYDTDGHINVTSTSEVFFKQFLPSAMDGKIYDSGTPEFVKIIEGMRLHGDSFMEVIQHYVQVNGSLSEQFNRDTGIAQGARDLTWSYASIITASQARAGEVPL